MSRPGNLRGASSTNITGHTAARSLEGKLAIVTGASRGKLHVLCSDPNSFGPFSILPLQGVILFVHDVPENIFILSENLLRLSHP